MSSLGSSEELDAHLSELRSRGGGIIDCIKSVRLSRSCSLSEAAEAVIDSPVWADRRDDYLRQQQVAFEEFLDYAKDRIEAVEQTFTPNGTTTIVRVKPPDRPDAPS